MMKNFFKKLLGDNEPHTEVEIAVPAPKNWNTWKVQYERLAGHLLEPRSDEQKLVFDHWLGNLTPEESLAHLQNLGFFK